MSGINKDQLLEIIYEAVNEFNVMLEDENRIETSPTAKLYNGGAEHGGGLSDETELINFLVTLDEIMDSNPNSFGFDLDFDLALEEKETAMQNLDSLAEFILRTNRRLEAND
jgi:hypothetical protein